MNKIYILPFFGIAVASFLGFQRLDSVSSVTLHVSNKSTSGSPGSYTGAPGESNCTACHSGGAVQDGSSENILTFTQAGNSVSEYTPGQTIDLNLMTLSNVTKKGFQITALDANNNPAGSFVATANTKLLSGGGTTAGRKYVTHNSGNNSSLGWDFSWTAPANPIGDVTFYLSTNKTNANGATSGDEIYLSQHVLGTSAGLVEKTKVENQFEVGFSPSKNQVVVNFSREDIGEMYINIVDLNGKSVFTQNLGKSVSGSNIQKIVLPSTVADGMHIVNFFVNNNVMSGKILIAK